MPKRYSCLHRAASFLQSCCRHAPDPLAATDLPGFGHDVSHVMVVKGCDFMVQGKHAVTLEKGLKAATVLGCLFRRPQAIVDQSGADVQTGLNTSN